jgi:ornithine--oxo-acid transaminase
VGVDIDPALASGRELVERLAREGVLSKETHETVIRFAPPLTIGKAMIDEAVERFRRVVVEKAEELGVLEAACTP